MLLHAKELIIANSVFGKKIKIKSDLPVEFDSPSRFSLLNVLRFMIVIIPLFKDVQVFNDVEPFGQCDFCPKWNRSSPKKYYNAY